MIDARKPAETEMDDSRFGVDLTGRVAIITGAGRGLGRAHALALAARGAAVVVNDLGVDVTGRPTPATPAQEVVEEICAAGGQAIASDHDVARWDQAGAMIQRAIDTFGDLHILVNNAGILRDRSLHNLSEDEWDKVISVHLKGHAAATHHAFVFWRGRHKAGAAADRSLVMTTSIAGLSGNFGQASYASAKAGILGLMAVAAIEGKPIGVRANAVSPGARTRMAMAVPDAAAAYSRLDAKRAPDAFDPMAVDNVSGLVAWLAGDNCPATRQIFHISGDQLTLTAMPRPVLDLSAEGRAWTPERLQQAVLPHLVAPYEIEQWSGFPDDFFHETKRARS